jgi:hypothetical protein
MSSEAKRKKRKRRWWVKTLLKSVGGKTLLENLSMEDRSGFRNFTIWIVGDYYWIQSVRNLPGIPRTTHSPDSFAVGLCMRNASVICRGKLLPLRAWYAVHFKHVCAEVLNLFTIAIPFSYLVKLMNQCKKKHTLIYIYQKRHQKYIT